MYNTFDFKNTGFLDAILIKERAFLNRDRSYMLLGKSRLMGFPHLFVQDRWTVEVTSSNRDNDQAF